MKIIIHRGAHQIGGCITEIKSDDAKILIDLGANLPGNNTKELGEIEVAELTKDVDAIFYLLILVLICQVITQKNWVR